jgi:hypothetical protein
MLKTMALLALVMLTSAASAPADSVTEHEERNLVWGWNTNLYQWYKFKRGRRIQADITLAPKNSDGRDIAETGDVATVIGKEVKPWDDQNKAGTYAVEWKAKMDKVLYSAVYSHDQSCADPPCKIGTGRLEPAICTDFNWHIHAKPINKDGSTPNQMCGPNVTSGHTDDGHNCGGASEFGKTICPKIWNQACPASGFDPNDPTRSCENDWKAAYGPGDKPKRCQKCNSEAHNPDLIDYCTGCEYGDQSGKIGKIHNDKGVTVFESLDLRIQNYESYAKREMSIVLHCCTAAGGCGERIACGDLELHRR